MARSGHEGGRGHHRAGTTRGQPQRSEARSLTNFSGNAVATILVASWTKTIDLSKADEVLRGRDPFDESTMVDPHDEEPPAATPHGGGVPTNPALCDFEQVSLGGLVGRPAGPQRADVDG